jgi:ADP-heptose:LPS heptosyltransferase
MRFDVAIDLFYNPRSANILFLSGIPVRVGGGRKWRRRLYTHIFDPRGAEGGAIGHHLAAVSALGCEPEYHPTRMFLTDKERAGGKDAAAGAFGGVMPARTVAMHPGGTWPAKRWDPSSFAALADLVSERFGARALLLTGPGQEEISRQVASRAGSGPAVLPVMPIREAASVMAACSAVVANDGGVMHAAVALGLPTVGIFGPTEPEIWFPYTGKGPWEVVTSGAPCAPCHLHECPDMRCLADISAGDAAGALARVTGWNGDG